MGHRAKSPAMDCAYTKFVFNGRAPSIPCTAFWRQSGVGTTLGTKNSEGLYLPYCPLLFISVSGSRCPAITPKSKLLFVSVTLHLPHRNEDECTNNSHCYHCDKYTVPAILRVCDKTEAPTRNQYANIAYKADDTVCSS